MDALEWNTSIEAAGLPPTTRRPGDMVKSARSGASWRARWCLKRQVHSPLRAWCARSDRQSHGSHNPRVTAAGPRRRAALLGRATHRASSRPHGAPPPRDLGAWGAPPRPSEWRTRPRSARSPAKQAALFPNLTWGPIQPGGSTSRRARSRERRPRNIRSRWILLTTPPATTKIGSPGPDLPWATCTLCGNHPAGTEPPKCFFAACLPALRRRSAASSPLCARRRARWSPRQPVA